MLILTDPIGDFEEFPAEDAKRPGSLSGLLFDFDIDGSKVKPKHIIWLDKAAKFMLKKGPTARWTAHIDGKASHTGEFSHNIGLSAKREQAVERELKKASGLSEPRLTVNFDFKGFDESKPVGEDKKDRAVYIVIQPPEFPPPPPKPNPKPKPKVDSNDFKIRLTRFISKGTPLPAPFDKGPTPAGGAAVFEMVDIATSRRAIFLLTAGGVQIPMPFDSKVNPPDLGGDNKFTNFHADSGSGPHRSIEFEDFEGDADFSRGPLGFDPRLKFNGDPAKFILRVTGKDVSKGSIAIDMDLDPDILFEGLSGKMQLLSQSLKL